MTNRHKAPVHIQAEYVGADLPEHRGNPLIEALPPFRGSKEMIVHFGRFPHYSDNERALPATTRLLAVERLNDYLEPLSEHFDLIDSTNLLIRAGYTNRNPSDPDYSKRRTAFYRKAMFECSTPIEQSSAPTSTGFALFGLSGSGKSSAIERVLSFLPQTLSHELHGFIQLVWLKVDCPLDGRLKQLLLSVIARADDILGTSYLKDHKPKNTDGCIRLVANIGKWHHLGALVIDEFQNLLDAPGTSHAHLLNFFVTLSNECKVPLIVVGTPKAQSYLQGLFREARRVGDRGTFEWNRLSHDGEEWSYFLECLWRYQWTAKPTELTPEMSKAMYSQTQGIKALVVRLFQLCQLQAIREGHESLSVGLITKVARNRFKLVEPMLKALRENNLEEIKKHDDLLATGLSELKDEIANQTKIDALRASQRQKAQEYSERSRAISALMAVEFTETQAQELVEEFYSKEGSAGVHEAVQSILNAHAPKSRRTLQSHMNKTTTKVHR